MNNTTKTIRLWCMNDEGLYTAIVDYVRDHTLVEQAPGHFARQSKYILINDTAEFMRDLLTAGIRDRDDLLPTIYMDLLNDVNFEEIASEFVDDVLWDVVWK